MVNYRWGAPIAAGLLIIACPGHSAPAQDRHWAMLAERMFPVLTAAATPSAAVLSASNRQVGKILADRQQRNDACQHVPKCVIEAAVWTNVDRDALAQGIENALHGRARLAMSAADEGIVAAVTRELDGVNAILHVYGEGAEPRYPQIDGPSVGVGTPEFAKTLIAAVAIGEAAQDDPVGRVDSSINLALALLDANDRGEAAAFEPLDARYNGAALARAKSIRWSRYRYTAIIVPGVGPEDPGVPLSAAGKFNVRLAAQAFGDAQAPYVILSGSTVHPRGTHFAEAIEMRRALIERYGVPEDCIVVDPYARHTTTNLRNATRRLVALHAPLDHDTLIVSNIYQIKYIQSADFAARNDHELGFQPGTVGALVSPNALIFRPSVKSLRIDPLDPLDP